MMLSQSAAEPGIHHAATLNESSNSRDDIRAALPACCWLWHQYWMGNSPAVGMTSRRHRTAAELGRCTLRDRRISHPCIHRITLYNFHFHTRTSKQKNKL